MILGSKADDGPSIAHLTALNIKTHHWYPESKHHIKKGKTLLQALQEKSYI